MGESHQNDSYRNTMYSNDAEIYQKELEQDYHLNRFQNEIIQIDCSNYARDTNQFNMFGHFSYKILSFG